MLAQFGRIDRTARARQITRRRNRHPGRASEHSRCRTRIWQRAESNRNICAFRNEVLAVIRHHQVKGFGFDLPVING
jgi:hypothetical protein